MATVEHLLVLSDSQLKFEPASARGRLFCAFLLFFSAFFLLLRNDIWRDYNVGDTVFATISRLIGDQDWHGAFVCLPPI